MDFSKMVRDADFVRKNVAVTADKKLIAKSDLSIIIPQRYVDIGLAKIGKRKSILAIYAIVVGNTYCVSIADAMIDINPDSIQEFPIGEDTYIEFKFEKGAVISPNLNLLKDDIFVYYIYAEFYSKGKAPVFFNARDMGMVLASAKKHAGLSLGANNLPTELIGSYTTRSSDDIMTFFRHSAKTLDDPKCMFVALDSVAFSTQDTTSKITGAYVDQGLTSALVTNSERISNFENLLRT